MKPTLVVLLIEDSADYAALVQLWLSLRKDVRFALHWTDSLSAGLKRLEQGGVDVILLDPGLPDSEGLETFQRTKCKAAGTPIIVLSGNDSETLALQMVQEGAQDYIAKTACNSEALAKAIQYAAVRCGSRVSRVGAQAAADQATVIGVIGAKGGVGGTTIACNLAIELRRQTEQKTLLADLDVSGGMVNFLTRTESEYSILDAVSNLHSLDASSWERMVACGPGDLDVVRSPSLLGQEEPDAAKLGQVLGSIRGFYRWIVVDF